MKFVKSIMKKQRVSVQKNVIRRINESGKEAMKLIEKLRKDRGSPCIALGNNDLST